MSRYYGMSVEISEFNPSKRDAIEKAACEEWEFENFDWSAGRTWLFGHGNSNLCGGESAEEFASRLAKAIWKANGRYCEVVVDAAYLENPPTEQYTPGLVEYKRVMGQKKPTKKRKPKHK